VIARTVTRRKSDNSKKRFAPNQRES